MSPKLLPGMSCGWSVTREGRETILLVQKHPRRISWALRLQDGSVIHTLAYFRNRDEAQRCVDFLDVLFAAQRMADQPDGAA